VRTYIVLVFGVVSLLFTGCETWPPADPNVTYATKKIGSPFALHGVVQFSIKRIDDHTYDILAYGSAEQTAQQYLDAWVWMADKLAAGRPYEKQTTIEPYEYGGSGEVGMPTGHNVGTMVRGRMVLK